MKNEIANLKKDRTELLTQQHRLKEENNSLRNELQEATDELNVRKMFIISSFHHLKACHKKII